MTTDAEFVLEGGGANAGRVVRVGNTVRRPRNGGSLLVEALLLHLESVGYRRAPRFHGLDELGRQVLDYVDGDVNPAPSWQSDDEANAAALGQLAMLVRDLHEATASFRPPDGATPMRPLPATGDVWSHGDIGYSNTVYRNGEVAAFIDWEFVGRADPVYDAASLLSCVRGPKIGVDDLDRRVAATVLAFDAIVDGYGMDDELRRRMPEVAAASIDDAADFWVERGQHLEGIERMRWRANWYRENAAMLVR